MIIYSKSSGLANSAIGKFENPIKMIIEHESDLITKKGNLYEKIFNVEKSSRYGESIVGQNEFDMFQAAKEGSGAEIDTPRDTFSKFIEHIQFMKEFVITAEMMEDAQGGIAAEAKRRAENFTRAYYKTINKLCSAALGSAHLPTLNYAKANIDLTTADGNPLFHNRHKLTNGDGVQSNYFWGSVFTKKDSGGKKVASTETFEEVLSDIAYKIRSMKDENGEPLGYTADTIILPGNCPVAETVAKKVCGTYGALGGNYNDINLNYGNWNIVVLPYWTSSDNRCIVMSSEANKSLSGNMFFNRVPLSISNWVDNHTGNYVWGGRCRFGIGFGSYKHAICVVDSESAIENANKL